MIKLADLIKEGEKPHVPYMYSAQGFSCKTCKYYFLDNGIHKCDNSNYRAFTGTGTLVDEKQKPINDPSKWCSDWFEPII